MDGRRPAAVGFHSGELAVQERAGVQVEAARLTPMVSRGELRSGVAAFLADTTFAALTARDRTGRLWTSPLLGLPGLLRAASSTTLWIDTAPPAADPLHGLPDGQPVGLIAIDFATRRRVRINGFLASAGASGLTVDVEQAYGNCPQYIQQRRLHIDPIHPDANRSQLFRGEVLRPEDIGLVQAADTFFWAPHIPATEMTPPIAAARPGSSGFPTTTCGGPTTRATRCSTASATSLSIPPPLCCSSTLAAAQPFSCPAPRRCAGVSLALATTLAPDVAWNSHRSR